MRMLTVEPLGTADRDRDLHAAAELLAREHMRARGERPGLPAAYAAPEHCHQALGRLVDDHAFLARDQGTCIGAVFATRPVRPTTTTAASGIAIRIATPDDLDSVARLSRVEHTQRSAPPIYSAPRPIDSTDLSDLGGFREHHRRLLDDGAVHLLARHHDADVGLLTLDPARLTAGPLDRSGYGISRHNEISRTQNRMRKPAGRHVEGRPRRGRRGSGARRPRRAVPRVLLRT